MQFFEKVLEENKERIYRICRIYAVNPIEPEDLFQEVVFQIWKSLARFEGKSDISTWIYRIALNVCMRSKLKLDKRIYFTVQLDSIHFEPTETSSNSGDEERFKALRACISTLNESDSSLMVLYLEDLPYKEIAGITGLSENHIAFKMKRIREKLFHCITPKLSN